MAGICNICGLPEELCICQEIAKEQQRAVISTDRRRYGKMVTIVEGIDDMSDQRTIWRLISDFTSSRIENSSFYNSNLSEVRFFGNKMSNLDFSNFIVV